MIGGAAYLSIGVVGYIVFRDSLDSNILLDFTRNLGSIFEVAVCFHLIFIIPGGVVISRLGCYRLFGIDIDESEVDDSGFYLWTVGLILILLLVSVII